MVRQNLQFYDEKLCLSQPVIHTGKFCFFLSFKFFKIYISEIPSMSNSLDPLQHMSGLIRVQTVCISYQETTLVGKEFIKFCTLYL